MTSRGRQRQSGLLLIEVLVCLVILGIVLIAALPRGPLRSESLQMRAATEALTETLKRARGQAIARNRLVAVVADVGMPRFRIVGESWHALPAFTHVSVLGTAELMSDAGLAAIVFYPDGSSSGGRIELSHAGRTSSLAVDWLTGKVRRTDAP